MRERERGVKADVDDTGMCRGEVSDSENVSLSTLIIKFLSFLLELTKSLERRKTQIETFKQGYFLIKNICMHNSISRLPQDVSFSF